MDRLSTLVATLLAVSIACERIVESLKGIFPSLWIFKRTTGNAEAQRDACLHILAGVCGAFVAWASGIHLQMLLGLGGNGGTAGNFLGYLVLGLLASGGSAFWNHVLDILHAAKVQQEHNAALAGGASPEGSAQTDKANVTGASAPV